MPVADISDFRLHPFGMLMPGRTYSAQTGYRYGFNGKENDNEIKGEGNQQDYGFRIYDPRIGKFLSVDPLLNSYPWYSPYHFAGNNPIHNIDLDGLEDCGYGQNLDRWTTQLSNKQITIEQYEKRKMAASIGGATGTVVAVTVYTGGRTAPILGRVFSFFAFAQGLSTQYHQPAKTAEEAKQRGNELLEFGKIWGSGETIGRAWGAFKAVATRIYYNFGSKALGEMGEEAMSNYYGTTKPSGKGSSFQTSLGTRKPDGIPGGTTASTTDAMYESKVGFQDYNGDIVKQVEKDKELLTTGKLKEITWVFWRSPNNGKAGASDELLKELKSAGIKTEIAGEIPKDILEKYVQKYKPSTTTKQP
jgi:RHS repeat-associated protein